MTKKDYILIADALREARDGTVFWSGAPDEVINLVANRIADKLQADNPRFDRKRFLEATR